MDTDCKNLKTWSVDDFFSTGADGLELVLAPGLLPEHILKANDLAAKGNLHEAIKHLNLIVPDEFPDDSAAGIFCLVTAMTFSMVNSTEKADYWFHKAVESLHHPAVLNEYACFCQSHGHLYKALSYRKQAFDMDPDNSVVRANLASDLVQTGSITEGIDLLAKAVCSDMRILCLDPCFCVICTMISGAVKKKYLSSIKIGDKNIL